MSWMIKQGNAGFKRVRLLNEMEHDVDNTSNRLQDGMKRMGDFIKANSDTKQQWCVVILIIILILLVVAVVYL